MPTDRATALLVKLDNVGNAVLWCYILEGRRDCALNLSGGVLRCDVRWSPMAPIPQMDRFFHPASLSATSYYLAGTAYEWQFH